MSDNCTLVDKISESLVDKSTALLSQKMINLALYKETKDVAEILTQINGVQVNVQELYNEMWLLDKETVPES